MRFKNPKCVKRLLQDTAGTGDSSIFHKSFGMLGFCSF